jgi:hypothetical protein
MRLITIALLIVATLATAHADDRKRHENKRHESHNYIIERQQAYQVQGVPTDRLIIGRRQIDGYTQRDGNKVWFEGNNVVGVKK